jgi:Circularly permutated YpsA SLOG family
MALSKIISGGQTGVDRGALDAALVAGFPCGGWCPADREAEDGEIPERYPLTPVPLDFSRARRQRMQGQEATRGLDAASQGESTDVRTARHVGEQYRARTLMNVQTSDGTVILFSETLSGGILLTQKLCVREMKPFLALDALAMTKLRAAQLIGQFLEEQSISVLNVAGPRLSGWPAGYRFALGVVGSVISNL